MRYAWHRNVDPVDFERRDENLSRRSHGRPWEKFRSSSLRAPVDIDDRRLSRYLARAGEGRGPESGRSVVATPPPPPSRGRDRRRHVDPRNKVVDVERYFLDGAAFPTQPRITVRPSSPRQRTRRFPTQNPVAEIMIGGSIR